MSSVARAEQPQGASSERVNGTNSGRKTIGTDKCQACLKTLPPGSGSRYCSARCRLRGWAVRDLAKALHNGTAEGLRGELAKLGDEAGQTRGGLTVEVVHVIASACGPAIEER